MLERVEKSGTLLIQGNESLEFYFHFVSHYFAHKTKELQLKAISSALGKMCLVAKMLEATGLATIRRVQTGQKTHVSMPGDEKKERGVPMMIIDISCSLLFKQELIIKQLKAVQPM